MQSSRWAKKTVFNSKRQWADWQVHRDLSFQWDLKRSHSWSRALYWATTQQLKPLLMAMNPLHSNLRRKLQQLSLVSINSQTNQIHSNRPTGKLSRSLTMLNYSLKSMIRKANLSGSSSLRSTLMARHRSQVTVQLLMQSFWTILRKVGKLRRLKSTTLIATVIVIHCQRRSTLLAVND